MRLLHHLLARCRALCRRDVVAGEIRDEMLFHLEMRAEEYEQRGLSVSEARRAASKRFGSLPLMQDRGYDVRGGGMVETVLQDVRFAVRLLMAHRAFSVVAILTLGVGIGVSTALFSVIDAVWLRPLPYPHSERMVDLMTRVTYRGEAHRTTPSIAEIRLWRADGRVLEHVGTGRPTGFLPKVVEAGQAERLVVGEVSEDFLEVYGITPVIGRSVTPDDTRGGAPQVVVLGHGYWQSRFGGDVGVLGHTIRVAGVPATIVGVLPAGFYRETSVWQPRQWPDSRLHHRGSGASVVGRLRPGVSRIEAARRLAMVSRQVAGDNREEVLDVRVRSLYEDVTSGTSRVLLPLAGAVGLIVLLGCVNVGGLLLARAAVREPELVVRASIGAGRGRLVRQLLTESLVLAGAGGLLGVLLAWTSLDALVGLVPIDMPSNAQPVINLTVLAGAAVLSVVTTLLFGLLPALRASRIRMGGPLAVAGGRQGSALSRRGGQWLIGAEVALATVLLAGAGLMVRSFARLMLVDVGFDSSAVMTLEVEPLDPAPAVHQQYYPALLAALGRLPGLAAVGAVDYLPLRDGTRVTFVEGAGSENLGMRNVLPGYFEAMGMRLRHGRFPTEKDRTSAEPIVLLNEEAARIFFPGRSPVGEYLHTRRAAPRRVIGVVSNVLHDGPGWEADPEAYVLYGQAVPTPGETGRPLRIVLRPGPSASVSATLLRQMAQSIGPAVLVERVRSSGEDFGSRVAVPRQRMWLLGLLGGLGMLLTLVGIASMTAYAVARRTREIGVRMALGAAVRNIVWRMVCDAAWPALIGLLAGLVGSFYATRVIASFLFQTTPNDGVTYATVAALMAGAAIVAAWLPARRAARVDPVAALRAE